MHFGGSLVGLGVDAAQYDGTRVQHGVEAAAHVNETANIVTIHDGYRCHLCHSVGANRMGDCWGKVTKAQTWALQMECSDHRRRPPDQNDGCAHRLQHNPFQASAQPCRNPVHPLVSQDYLHCTGVRSDLAQPPADGGLMPRNRGR